MPGEDKFDASVNDKDSQAFRESSIPRVNQLLGERLEELRGVLETKDSGQIADFFIRTADDLDRAVVGLGQNEDIASAENTVITHAFGLVFWKKPASGEELNEKVTKETTTAFTNGEIDKERLGKGLYFLTVLLHRYKNGNGRTARGLKALVDKTDSAEGFSEQEVKTILAVGRKGVIDKGEGKFSINFHPDFEKLVLGVCYFGLQKGLAMDRIIDQMGLNSKLPENGLELLAKELKVGIDQLKSEFIQFMAVDSALEWIYF